MKATRLAIPAVIVLAGLGLAAACGAPANPRGSLSPSGDSKAGSLPRPGRYACMFEFVRLDPDRDSGSLASPHVTATSDRFYGQHPISHASEMCEISEGVDGAEYLLIPGQPHLRIEPGSEGGFRLLWDGPADFRRIDDATFQGQVRTESGIETITLYYRDSP